MAERAARFVPVRRRRCALRWTLAMLCGVLAISALAASPASARRHRRARVHHFSGIPPKVPIVRLDGRVLRPAEIDSTVVRLMRSAGVPGLGLALIHGGHVAYLKAYGLRDVERGLPMTAGTVLCAGSLTEGLVARAAVQMALNGALPLDISVADSLAALRTGEGPFGELAADPRTARITPRMLLAHTSGLAAARADEPDGRLGLRSDPGARFGFSGADYRLLQAAMERAGGDSLEELVTRRVFAPLGMWRSSLVWRARFDDDAATGYDGGGHPVTTAHPATADAGRSLSTTLEDFARVLASQLGGSELAMTLADSLLARQVDLASGGGLPALDSLPSPATRGDGLGYALGWDVFRTPRGTAFFLDGRAPGWRHYAVGFRDTGDGLLIMSNSAKAGGTFAPLLAEILADTWTPAAWKGFAPGD